MFAPSTHLFQKNQKTRSKPKRQTTTGHPCVPASFSPSAWSSAWIPLPHNHPCIHTYYDEEQADCLFIGKTIKRKDPLKVSPQSYATRTAGNFDKFVLANVKKCRNFQATKQTNESKHAPREMLHAERCRGSVGGHGAKVETTATRFEERKVAFRNKTSQTQCTSSRRQ